MKKKTKIKITIISVSVFILLAPLAVLYSQGYRVTNGRIVKTGGLFFNITPESASVQIDDKKIKKTRPVWGSLLVEGILPKEHQIRITKEDFQPWTKTLQVEEERVTSAKSVRLVPENIQLTLLQKDVDDFWANPEIIIQQEDLFKTLEQILFQSETLASANLSHLSPDRALLEDEGLSSLEISTGKKTVLLERLRPYNAFENSIIYLNKNNQLVEIKNLESEIIFEEPLNDIKSFRFSPSGSKIATNTDHEIKIIFLKDQNIQPLREKGQRVFLSRLSQKIQDVFWWDDFHLILHLEDGLKIIELDNRDGAQTWNLLKKDIDKFYFNQKDRRMYLLSDKTLFRSEEI